MKISEFLETCLVNRSTKYHCFLMYRSKVIRKRTMVTDFPAQLTVYIHLKTLPFWALFLMCWITHICWLWQKKLLDNAGFCGRVVCVLGYSARGCGFEPRRDQGCDNGLYPPKAICHQTGISTKSLVPAGKLWPSYANVMPIVSWRKSGSRTHYVSGSTQVTSLERMVAG